MGEFVTLETDGGIGTIRLNRPPVNALNDQITAELAEAAGQALGSVLTVRVLVALGELTSDDVAVEVVYGRPDDADEIISPAYATLTPDPVGAAGGVARYSGEVSLDQPGPFGYTVRVLPNHPLLDSRAELGLVTYPQAPAGMTNGDLR